MKVSSIIKTPVEIDGSLIYELMDWQTKTGKPTKVNRWSAPVQGPDNIMRAKVIAHAIDSHDALVDMVRRLRSKLIVLQWSARDESEGETDVCPECGGTPVKSHEHGGHYGMCGIGKSIREADELLKGEDG